MLDVIRTSHHQLADGLAVGLATPLPEGKFQHIIFAGMGGSSMVAELIKDYVREEIAIDIIQDYELPLGLVTDHTLFIAFSYSGNTEETIGCMQQALHTQRVPVVVVSHGGEMEQIARSLDLPFFHLPKSPHPRVSMGYGLGVLLGIIQQTGLLPEQSCTVRDTMAFIENEMSSIEEDAKHCAQVMQDKVPVFYAASHASALPRMYKIHVNENAKIQSFSGVVPEMNHNEMVGYTKLLMSPVVVCLRSSFETARIQQRFHVMKELLVEECHVPVHEIRIHGNSWLEEAYYVLVHAYCTSFFLAEYYGVDPKELDLVKLFKERLHHA